MEYIIILYQKHTYLRYYVSRKYKSAVRVLSHEHDTHINTYT